MNIDEAVDRQSRIRAYIESRTRMRRAVQKEYDRMGALLLQLAELQSTLTSYADADAGTVEAEIYAMHRAVFPVETDAQIGVLAAKAVELRTTIETVDSVSGGAWFGIVMEEH